MHECQVGERGLRVAGGLGEGAGIAGCIDKIELAGETWTDGRVQVCRVLG